MTATWPLDAPSLAELLGGEWTTQPPDDWVLSALESTGRVTRRGKVVVGTLTFTTPSRLDLSTLEETAGGTGALALLAEHDRDLGETEIPILRVADVKAALDTLSHRARERFSGLVIAVTGSAGKTTTKRMLSQVLGPHLSIYESSGNHPMAVRAGAYGLGAQTKDVGLFEVSSLCFPGSEQFLRPDIAVITSIGEAHTDVLGDLEGVARTKSILFEGLAEGGTAIINLDSPHSDLLVEKAHRHASRVITYGQSAAADLHLLSYDHLSGEVTVAGEGEELSYVLGVPGTHNALNSLAVLGVLHTLGRDRREHLEVLRSLQLPTGRGNVADLVLGATSFTLADQSYNANPASMRAALTSFGQQFSGRRKILVLGDMLELGPTAGELHRGIVDAVLESEPAAVFLVGPLMGGLWADLPDHVRVMHSMTADVVRAAVPSVLEDGDAVLVKASNGTGLADVVAQWTKASQPRSGAWRIVITGTVQKVGYRRWARGRARQHGVHGWIRNRSDGAVEALAQGHIDQLGRFLGDLHDGPPQARVGKVSTRVVDSTDERDFRLRRTRTIEQRPEPVARPSRARRLARHLPGPVRKALRRAP